MKSTRAGSYDSLGVFQPFACKRSVRLLLETGPTHSLVLHTVVFKACERTFAFIKRPGACLSKAARLYGPGGSMWDLRAVVGVSSVS